MYAVDLKNRGASTLTVQKMDLMKWGIDNFNRFCDSEFVAI